MIRFAVIGTNWITRQFVEAAHESGKCTEVNRRIFPQP